MKSLASYALMGGLVMAGPAPTPEQLENYTYSAQSGGCAESMRQAMQHSPFQIQGEGGLIHINFDRHQIANSAEAFSTSTQACFYQASRLLTRPDNGEQSQQDITIDLRGIIPGTQD